jgi:hypothetical protein
MIGRGKAFFFFNQEELYNPFENARSRTIIRESALNGNYTYGPTGATTTVNVLAIRLGHGQHHSYDPTIRPLLESIRAAAGDDRNDSRTHHVAEHGELRLSLANQNDQPRADDEPDVEHDAEASFAGFVLLAALQARSGRAEQRRPDLPGVPAAFGNASQYRTDGIDLVARRRCPQRWSTNCAAAGRGRPVGFFTNANAGMFDNQAGHNIGFRLWPERRGARRRRRTVRTEHCQLDDQRTRRTG